MQGDTPYIPVTAAGARPPTATPQGGPGGEAGAAAGESGAGSPAVSLDSFLAGHTSEDNASFQKILEDVNKRRRLRAATLAPARDPQLLLTDGREATDGFGTGGQPTDTLLTWPHQPANTLMYDLSDRDSVPLSAAERAAQVQGPPKAINHRATRFAPAGGAAAGGEDTPTASGASGAAIGSGSAAAAAAAGGGGAGGGAVAAAAGGTRGYGILATPSFDPGVEDSPLVTWGDIEATPLRIEVEDLPPGGMTGGWGRQAARALGARGWVVAVVGWSGWLLRAACFLRRCSRAARLGSVDLAVSVPDVYALSLAARLSARLLQVGLSSG